MPVQPRLPETLVDSIQDVLAKCGAQVTLPTEAANVLALSPFVAQSCERKPELLKTLLEEQWLQQAYEPGELAERIVEPVMQIATEQELSVYLRRLRQQEMVRIAWRDLAGFAALEETLWHLTELAETCIQAAVDWHHKDLAQRHGSPMSKAGESQSLVVLGMGKLGGHELNYSSDIDLIFAYPETGETTGPRVLENQQFFIKLGQKVIKALDEITAEGFVFRVDMRLRPFGDSGPLVMHFDAMEHYFQLHGREWERYAMIKARVVAGDKVAGRDLMQRLRPFIYRRYLDFSAFENLREMKALIDREAKRRGKVGDVKLGAGGIREVEFTAQAFQLIRGGRDTSLQQREVQVVIQRLYELDLIPEFVARQLQQAYVFLRRTENHIQMLRDQQTHALPTEAIDQLRIAISMGFADWQAFSAELAQHQAHVAEHFEQVFAAPQADSEKGGAANNDLTFLWEQGYDSDFAETVLADLGFKDLARVEASLQDFRASNTVRALTKNGVQRVKQLMPLLINAAALSRKPDLALQRALQVVSRIAKRAVYFALLVENPLALAQLIRLVEASPWITEQMARFPILLDELLNTHRLYKPLNRQQLTEELEKEFEKMDEDDLEEQMDRLRHFKQAQVLKVAAADVMDVLPLMSVSDQLSWIAEAVLEKAVAMAWEQMQAKHGEPSCEVDGETRKVQFGVIGYGKLGGLELGYGSDLDIVLVNNSEGSKQVTDGARSVDNAVFFARLGQKITHILTILTRAGTLYEVDQRLRPNGNSGMMVPSLKAFAQYQADQAWTWEHQALVRARMVLGPAEIEQEFIAIRQAILGRERDKAQLKQEVREMRHKMWESLGCKTEGKTNLKKDPGGIADIEFMVQYYVLAYAQQFPSLTQYSDNVRALASLAEAALIPEETAQFLADTYRSLRDRTHALALQERNAVVGDHEFSKERAKVRELWQQWMES